MFCIKKHENHIADDVFTCHFLVSVSFWNNVLENIILMAGKKTAHGKVRRFKCQNNSIHSLIHVDIIINLPLSFNI